MRYALFFSIDEYGNNEEINIVRGIVPSDACIVSDGSIGKAVFSIDSADRIQEIYAQLKAEWMEFGVMGEFIA